MMKRVVVSLLCLLCLGASLCFAQSTASVYAASPQQEVCNGISAASGSGDCKSDISLTTVIRNVIKIFSVIIGIVAVIMVMVAGFKYITAHGESSNVSSAKNTLVYAIVGLVVAALSQAIVQFVLHNVK